MRSVSAPLVTYLILGLVGSPLCVLAQESVRDVRDDGWMQKYLTPDTLDTWKFTARDDALLLIAIVETREFDPTLKLADAPGNVLVSRDDDGSSSRLVWVLPAAGKYELRVHGYEQRGGGNYRIFVERLPVRSMQLGEPTGGEFTRHRTSCFRFDARVGEHFSFATFGTEGEARAIGPDGHELPLWGNTFHATADGPHFFRVGGREGRSFQVIVHREPTAVLERDVPATFELAPGRMRVFEFESKRRDFRIATIGHRRGLHSRVVRIEKDELDDDLDPSIEPLRFLPVASKGNETRHAFVVQRPGRFELQVLSKGSAEDRIEIRLADPSISIEPGTLDGGLPVGGAAFHTFTAQAGDYLAFAVSSTAFDPLLRLTGPDGQALATDDDGGADLDCAMRYLVRHSGRYRLQTSSSGDGGGGPFALSLSKIDIPKIAAGDAREVPCVGGTSYWHLDGSRGQRLLITASSASIDPALELMAPSGAVIANDDDGGIGHDSLLAVELPEDGRYTIGVVSTGDGMYQLRVIDG